MVVRRRAALTAASGLGLVLERADLDRASAGDGGLARPSASAASRSGASMTQKPPSCSLVSAYGPSVMTIVAVRRRARRSRCRPGAGRRRTPTRPVCCISWLNASTSAYTCWMLKSACTFGVVVSVNGQEVRGHGSLLVLVRAAPYLPDTDTTNPPTRCDTARQKSLELRHGAQIGQDGQHSAMVLRRLGNAELEQYLAGVGLDGLGTEVETLAIARLDRPSTMSASTSRSRSDRSSIGEWAR